MLRVLLWASLACAVGCAHRTVVANDLDRAQRPAFVARIEENAGPQTHVFREDDSWHDRLHRLEPREADRRLQVKLAKAVTRFHVSDGLRASVLALLPKTAPWTRVLPAANVASALDSFLVEEVPANLPDYELLGRLGADSVIELVVQDYGMEAEKGKGHPFLRGYGHMFFIGGPEIWYQPFLRQGEQAGIPALDPFEVAKNPDLFREAFEAEVESVAVELAKGLSPEGGHARPPTGPLEPPPALPPENTTHQEDEL